LAIIHLFVCKPSALILSNEICLGTDPCCFLDHSQCTYSDPFFGLHTAGLYGVIQLAKVNIIYSY
ncbi:MAG: hypothetical protein JAY73_12555, partial [Candidatus Thiodiazotropha taylori]|nr:hypothetical protein [Candidatus Thiodiazotropha taylori]